MTYAGHGLLVLCALTFARAANAAEKPGAVVFAGAPMIPFGRATGAVGDGAREVLGNAFHLSVGARLRLAPRVRLALDAGVEVGQAGLALRRVCEATDTTCFLFGGTLALDAEVPVHVRRGWELWVRDGVGMEIVNAGAFDAAPAVLLIGFDFARPAVGIDWYVTERTRLGAFAQCAFGTYAFTQTTGDLESAVLRSIGDQAVHGRCGIGARWVLQ